MSSLVSSEPARTSSHPNPLSRARQNGGLYLGKKEAVLSVVGLSGLPMAEQNGRGLVFTAIDSRTLLVFGHILFALRRKACRL